MGVTVHVKSVPREVTSAIMSWQWPAIVLLAACAGSSIPFGVWVLATSRWPSWMRGALKWPLGDKLSPQVIRLQGWSYVFVGSASLVLTVQVLALPTLISVSNVVFGIILTLDVGLLVCGVVPYVRSLRMSRI
jgi:hypothetical protein